jgi:hypothetical protein
MKVFRYSLEKGSKKHVCPQCRQISFVRAVDNELKVYLPDHVGRCERINSCGYQYKISDYVKGSGVETHKPIEVPDPEPTFITQGMVDSSMLRGGNKFLDFLNTNFPSKEVRRVRLQYRLGTIDKKVVFWQIDKDYNIRSGKIMEYNAVTGKRDKNKHPMWVHKPIKNFVLKQCLFGEHLLNEKYADRVEVVESEKTAVIMSLFYPQKIWMATGGLQNLSLGRLDAIKGKKITLHPDGGAYEIWKDKVFGKIDVSDFMEKHSVGDDIADYYLSRVLTKYYELL